MRVHVGCKMIYESEFPTPTLLVIRPMQQYYHRVLEEQTQITPEISIHEYLDGFGNFIWRLMTTPGTMEIEYHAIAEVSPLPDLTLPSLPKTPVENLPDDVIIYTLPSRHCPSDLFIADAWSMFGHIQDGWQQVQAVCDWLHTNILYSRGSNSSTTGWDAYQAKCGVCRDFAHLGVSFCRALNFPARYVCGYLPDINVPFDPTPMDFHAWFEVYMDGSWHTFDARHNKPRTGRVMLARGRDAVDVALMTAYGNVQMPLMKVWAEQVADNQTLDAFLKESSKQHG